MAVSRREFLQRGGMLAVGAALPLSALGRTLPQAKAPGAGAPGTGSASPDPQVSWSEASFLACVGTEFATQQSPDQKVWLLLTGVTDMSAPAQINPATMAVPPPITAPAPQVECFALSFSASLAQPLTQNTYSMDHATLGQFPLFIVPGQPGGQTYFAIVNRLVTGTPGKIVPGKIGPPVSITAPPTGGSPATGSGSGTGNTSAPPGGNPAPGGGAVPRPNPESGPGMGPGPVERQPDFNRE
jgi:hypothetical protein